MAVVFNWTKREGDAAHTCEMPRRVFLYVSPDRSDGFGNPKRGTKWRYGASQTTDPGGVYTISQWGRDTYDDLCKSLDEAKRKAEAHYAETVRRNPSA